MNGAELLMKTAEAAGIRVCFANPGTTELPLVEALENTEKIRSVLGLFEGCCTGAADGFGRMTGKPAMTLLHLGPGLANGIANLHNARRARTPLINLIGEHATWHQWADAPLTMDIQGLAGTVCGWQKTVERRSTISADMVEAVSAANAGQVATLVIPHDLQWEDAVGAIEPFSPGSGNAPDARKIEEAAARIKDEGERAVILLGGAALKKDGLMAADAVSRATRCALVAETFPARMERGVGVPNPVRLPYFRKAGAQLLSRYETVVLAGAREPVSFFGYQDGRSRYLSDHQRLFDITEAGGTPDRALTFLADTLGNANGRAPGRSSDGIPETPSPLPDGPLTADAACAVLAGFQPENAIVVDEAVTSGGAYYNVSACSSPFTLLTLTGGSLGMGLPCAAGAAIACPDRPVISLQADGSAMYTCQSLWMHAREKLNITTLLCVNNRYGILKLEMARAGREKPGAVAERLTDLGDPGIDWVKLSQSMGVPAVSVNTVSGLASELKSAFTAPGPHLIAMQL